MTDNVYYVSKTKQKREARLLEQELFLKEKREKQAMESLQKRWNEAQIKAASAQSVLDYMVEIFEKNKKELTEEQITQTKEQIKVRQKEIEEFIMIEKSIYTQSLKKFNEDISKEIV